MKDIVLIGASGVAHQIIDTIYDINKVNATWNLRGIIDDDPEKTGLSFYGNTQVIGTTVAIKDLDLSHTWFLVTFSSPQCFLRRESYVWSLLTTYPNIQFASIIHPSVYVSRTAKVGKGVFLGVGTCVDAHPSVGDHVIALFNSVISRFVTIGNYTFISSCVNITGNQNIGENAYLGVNTTIYAHIGNKVLLSAATIVKQSVPDKSIVSNKVSQDTHTYESAEQMQMMLGRMFAWRRNSAVART